MIAYWKANIVNVRRKEDFDNEDAGSRTLMTKRQYLEYFSSFDNDDTVPRVLISNIQCHNISATTEITLLQSPP